MTAIRESRESRELATPSVPGDRCTVDTAYIRPTGDRCTVDTAYILYSCISPEICNTHLNFSAEKEEENRMEEEEQEEQEEGLMTRVSSTERGLCALCVHTLSYA